MKGLKETCGGCQITNWCILFDAVKVDLIEELVVSGWNINYILSSCTYIWLYCRLWDMHLILKSKTCLGMIARRMLRKHGVTSTTSFVDSWNPGWLRRKAKQTRSAGSDWLLSNMHMKFKTRHCKYCKTLWFDLTISEKPWLLSVKAYLETAFDVDPQTC